MNKKSPVLISVYYVLGLAMCLFGAQLAYRIYYSIQQMNCYGGLAIYTWIDRNQNGSWDDEEAPLEGVAFTIIDRGEPISRVSDAHGEIILSNRHCERIQITDIDMLIPDGYRQTTSVDPNNIRDYYDAGTKELRFYYGFVEASAP